MGSDQTKGGLRLVEPDSVNYYFYDGKYNGLDIPDIKMGIAMFIIGPVLTVLGHAILNEPTHWNDNPSDFLPSTRVRTAHVTKDAINLYRKHTFEEDGIPKVFIFAAGNEERMQLLASKAVTLSFNLLEAEPGWEPRVYYYTDEQYSDNSTVFIKTADGSRANCETFLCGEQVLSTTVFYKIPADWADLS